MTNGVFTEILLGLLALLLVIAAVIDVRTFTISNRLNLTVALLAPLWRSGSRRWRPRDSSFSCRLPEAS